MVKFYLVGGAVRDKILGRESKDLDYAVEASSYEEMKKEIIARGGQIFLETPQYLTIRAKVPDLGVSDYVLCRKEAHYSDGRHPENVTIGTLYDDLSRRDFSMNAMAVDEEGNLHDYFGGRDDIGNEEINCVGIAYDRLNEDRLRILRAIRFAIQLNFDFSMELEDTIFEMLQKEKENLFIGVSIERIREELYKCFRADTPKTISMLDDFRLLNLLFGKSLWLKPTLEQ